MGIWQILKPMVPPFLAGTSFLMLALTEPHHWIAIANVIARQFDMDNIGRDTILISLFPAAVACIAAVTWLSYKIVTRRNT